MKPAVNDRCDRLGRMARVQAASLRWKQEGRFHACGAAGRHCDIGILTSLLMPAVQAARGAARQAQCRNNLKQIGVSFHNFKSARRFFPGHGGGREPRGVDFGAAIAHKQGIRVTGNWAVQSLFFMEQGLVADVLIAAAQGKASPAELKKAVAVPIPTLYCPSRRECWRIRW